MINIIYDRALIFNISFLSSTSSLVFLSSWLPNGNSATNTNCKNIFDEKTNNKIPRYWIEFDSSWIVCSMSGVNAPSYLWNVKNKKNNKNIVTSTKERDFSRLLRVPGTMVSVERLLQAGGEVERSLLISLLHSHWSRSNEARLSLVESFIVLLR